jgi:lipopolysaccharide transport system ATP-binding protein
MLAIQVGSLSKRYTLGAMTPYQHLVEMVKPSKRDAGRAEFWALKDVSFAVKQGESIGIIGRNGAGKSTLLKVLSRITAPTEGIVRVRGRVGTLLEVGTGFHPELSGRENVFLSGAILGLTPNEIRRRFDEIVEFAEVEGFIDTPVKRYSSGMQVRLAFAVASCLQPEILIVDEVLAVGDLGFQRKSIGRLQDAVNREGRTVLFVSHSLGAIKKFCQRVIVLESGMITFDGETERGIEYYVSRAPRPTEFRDLQVDERRRRGANGAVRFCKCDARDANGELRWYYDPGESVTLHFEFEVFKPIPNLNLLFDLCVRDEMGGGERTAGSIWAAVCKEPLLPGYRGRFVLELPNLRLKPGEFFPYIWLASSDESQWYDLLDANLGLPALTIRGRDVPKAGQRGLFSMEHCVRARTEDFRSGAASPVKSEKTSIDAS